MNTNEAVKSLALYGLEKELFSEEDMTYVINSILGALELDSFEDCEITERAELEDILEELARLIDAGVIREVAKSDGSYDYVVTGKTANKVVALTR